MSKLLKLLAALLVLSVVAAAIASFFVDADDFKEDVERRFAAATGRQLVIAGHLRISLLPRPFLEVTDTWVPGALAGESQSLVKVDRVFLYPRLGPLIHRRLELDLVRAEGLRLRLIRDEHGRSNWDRADVSQPPKESAQAFRPQGLAWSMKVPGPLDVMAAEAPSPPGGLVIRGIEVRNAQVTWDDRRSGRQLEIGDLEVFAGPVTPDEPVPLRLEGSLGNGTGHSPVPLRAEGRLSLDDGPRRPRLEQATLQLEGLSLGQGLAADLRFRTVLEADLDAQRYLAEDAALDMELSGKALSNHRIKANASGRAELDLKADRLEVGNLRIRSGALSAKGTAQGQSLFVAPLLTGNLVVDELDLRAWLEERGLSLPTTADAETFRRFSLDTRWRLEGDQLAMHDLALDIDQTRLTGKAERTATSPPGYRFDLMADRLDLNPYMPTSARTRERTKAKSQQPEKDHSPLISKAENSNQLPSRSGTATIATVRLPALPRIPVALEAIANLDLDGRLRAGELQTVHLRFGDANIEIKARDRSLDIDNRIQRFYGGQLAGSLGLDLRGAQPRVTLTQRANGIHTGLLLADLVAEERFTGRGTIEANLTATGRSSDALRRNLTGNLTIDVPEGRVKDVNLERLVREAEARLGGKHPPADLPTNTDFKDLRATAQVQGGILRNQDLFVRTDYVRVTGEGTVNLAEERFDYRFEPIFVKPPKGRGIKELEGIPIPVHLTGPFSHPRWDVDLHNVIKAAAARRLGGQEGDLFHELEKRTGIRGLEQGLKGLLGR
jgi:AsmA protein